MREIKVALNKFLSAFFNSGEECCIRIFSDKKGSEFKGKNVKIPLDRVNDFKEMLLNHNRNQRGIFYVVNYGGHNDKDIIRVNAQFVENDELTIEEQYKNLMDFPLEPSIIVKTKKSLHGYWLIKSGEIGKFREVQKALAHYFKGDKTIINESRVLRLPGFYHCKGEPTMVTCLKFNKNLRYTQQELLKHMPKEINTENETSEGQEGLELVTSRCEFIKHCREKAMILGEHDWYAMITNLSVFKGGEEEIHKLSSPYPKYTKEETNRKIQHFLKSGTKPMHCTTIGEKGFLCPKLKEGACKCKSPAGLAFMPLDIYALVEVLNKQPVEGNALRDVEVARTFIERYLGEIDELSAKIFISSEVKKHFGIKEPYVKDLIKKYKEFRREKANQTKDKVAKEEGLPPWYEEGERGIRFKPGILATYMSENLQGIYSAEEYYIYNKGVYREVNELVAAKIVRDHLIDKYTILGNITDALGQWQILIYKDVNLLNPDPYKINLKNGIYDLRKNKLLPHNHRYLSTVQINANYKVGAKCTRFMQFLQDSLGDEEIKIVQEILGYLLVPMNKAQKAFVFVGAGNAGKSTLLSVAQEILLGRRNVSNVPWQALGDRFKTAELFGKLANVFADLPSKSIDDNGIFKSITGEDYITVEKKNKTPFSFKPYSRLLFSCNDIPRNYGDKSSAFYRRLVIIRFSKAVPEDKRDPNLKEKLEKEADGILLWALEGLNRLIENNFVFSESERTKAELERYRTECNSILSFVQDCCIIDAEKSVELKELYNAYREYCEESGLSQMSQKRFSKELKDGFQELVTTNDAISRRLVFIGISLN